MARRIWVSTIDPGQRGVVTPPTTRRRAAHVGNRQVMMAGSRNGGGDAEPVVTERVLRTRKQVAAEATQEMNAPPRVAATRKRGRRSSSTRGESDGDDAEDVKDAENEEATGGRRNTRVNAAKKAKTVEEQTEKEEAQDSEDDDALLASVSRETRKFTSASKRKHGTILAEFTSLDALLNNDLEEKKKKAATAVKLKRLREEGQSVVKKGKGGGGSPLAKIMSDMEQMSTSLDADSHLFSEDMQPPRSHEEKFGFVFMPMTQPLVVQPFKATTAELQSDLRLVYKAMQTKSDEELAALLWSKAILLRALLSEERAANKTVGLAVQQPVVLPARIGAWLFSTMSTHSDSHIVKGCLSNLFLLISGTNQRVATELKSGLPCASFCHSVQDMRTVLADVLPDIKMEWRPTVYDFLNAFRCFGFQDSKRSMSARSKITTTKASAKSSSQSRSSQNKSVPFPTLNMQYVLVFLILSLRANLLQLDGYDAFSFTMFFLRMQFEQNMHPEIVQLATICIEELLEVFPTMEWRKEWGVSLVLRIAGVNEGLFDSASGWLLVARRLPRTTRGTQLTTGLAIYVLQHRIDKSPEEVSKSERPLKFPIQSGLVLDIVAGIVEDMTAKYTEKKRNNVDGTNDGKPSRLPTPPFDLLSKKVALMDLALQAFLNELTQQEMKVLLGKLDDLTNSHKSTMSAKWHELKTLVSLMHRKYSLENLRVGRKDPGSPRAKAVLFLDDDIKGEDSDDALVAQLLS